MPREKPHEPAITPLYARYRIEEQITILNTREADDKGSPALNPRRPPLNSSPFCRTWLRYWWWVIFLGLLFLLLAAFLLVYEVVIPLLIRNASIKVSALEISHMKDTGFRILLSAKIQGIKIPWTVHGFSARVLDDRNQALYTLQIPTLTDDSVRIEQRVYIANRQDFVRFAALLTSNRDVLNYITGRVKVEMLRKTLHLDLRKEVLLQGLGPSRMRVQSVSYQKGKVETLIDTTYDARGQVSLDFGLTGLMLQFGHTVIGRLEGPLKLKAGTTDMTAIGRMTPASSINATDVARLKHLIEHGRDVPLTIAAAHYDRASWADACLRSFEGAVFLSPAQAKAVFPELTVGMTNPPAL